MKPLTYRQTEVLAYMFRFFDENDQPPTMAEIARFFGWKSANAADQICRILHAKKMLQKNVLGKYKFSEIAKSQRAIIHMRACI